MKLLRVIASINPVGGGPIEGINLVSQVHQDMGISVDICCLDGPEDVWVKESKFTVHALGPCKTKYAYNRRLIPWLKANVGHYDAVIVSGLWQFHGFAVWHVLADSSIPYYVFTHGMLDPWFKYNYPLKHLKKWLYWPWAEYRVLRDARKVIFTCEEERILARQSFWLYKVNEAVTAYGVAEPPDDKPALISSFLERYPELHGKRLILFLSRIHKKKGCDLLIEAFAKLIRPDDNLHLVMAGPDQSGWVRELKIIAERLGVSGRITWPGMLHGRQKWGAFYASDVFCLPSHQENFGIVVAEALACGKPVLLTNKVNIWREIEADNAGYVADDDLAGITEILDRWLGLTRQESEALQINARICFRKHFHIQRAAERLLEIIQESR